MPSQPPSQRSKPSGMALAGLSAGREFFLDACLQAVEGGLVPDAVVRAAICKLCGQRLAELSRGGSAAAEFRQVQWLRRMNESRIAESTEAANEQHYEVPTEFYRLVLGEHFKYSCGFWPPGVDTLSESEAAMLALTAERAGLEDGQRILELGCGWGSLTLWMAEHFKRSFIVAVSNSATQREHIEAECERRGLCNVRVITRDVNDLHFERKFDRVVSVEMFEHVRNWAKLFDRVETWLEDDGRFFMHVFCHDRHAYPFDVEGADNWMGRYFFTGGHMPSADLPERLSGRLEVQQQWRVDGKEYQRTAEAWLENLDANRAEAEAILARTHAGEAKTWFRRWRLFFLSCAELFGYDEGREWYVAHALLAPRPKPPAGFVG